MEKPMKRNSTQLKQRMEGHWLEAFRALAPALETAVTKLGMNVPCPIDGGIDGFRLFRDANDTGGGVKQNWRVIPEGIDMLMWVNDWSFTKAYDELEAYLGNESINPGPVWTPKPIEVDESRLRQWLNRIWKESIPLDSLRAFPARAYFDRRHLKAKALQANDLRFHPALQFIGADGIRFGNYGAILALVRNNEGVPVSIHRTFITKSGLKVDFLGQKNKPKKLTPAVNKPSPGRQVRLFAPTNGLLGVSEGLETALAVTIATGFPVWPNLSNTMLTSFVPPPGVHTVINFVDKDRKQAGERSAELLEHRLQEQGTRVISLLPPTPILESDSKGVDWADQLVRDRKGFDLLRRVLKDQSLKTA